MYKAAMCVKDNNIGVISVRRTYSAFRQLDVMQSFLGHHLHWPDRLGGGGRNKDNVRSRALSLMLKATEFYLDSKIY